MKEYILIHKDSDGETRPTFLTEEKIKSWMKDGSLEDGDKLYLITKRYEIIKKPMMIETKIKVIKKAPK